MRTAAVSTLKASLSEYLATVKSGEEVIVTDRGKAIAKIVPITRTDERISGRLLALEKAGLVKIGGKYFPDNFWDGPHKSAVDIENKALSFLLEERREGR